MFPYTYTTRKRKNKKAKMSKKGSEDHFFCQAAPVWAVAAAATRPASVRRRSWESGSGALAAEEAVSGAGVGLNAAAMLPMASAVAEGKEVEVVTVTVFEGGEAAAAV